MRKIEIFRNFHVFIHFQPFKGTALVKLTSHVCASDVCHSRLDVEMIESLLSLDLDGCLWMRLDEQCILVEVVDVLWCLLMLDYCQLCRNPLISGCLWRKITSFADHACGQTIDSLEISQPISSTDKLVIFHQPSDLLSFALDHLNENREISLPTIENPLKSRNLDFEVFSRIKLCLASFHVTHKHN